MKYLIDYFDSSIITHIAEIAKNWRLLSDVGIRYIKLIGISKFNANSLSNKQKVNFYKLFLELLKKLPKEYECTIKGCQFCERLHTLKFSKKNQGYFKLSRQDLHLAFSKLRENIDLKNPKSLKLESLNKSSQREELSASIQQNYIKYEFEETVSEPTSFFSIKTKGDKIVILLNKKHPFTKAFLHISNGNGASSIVNNSEDKTKQAFNLLKLLMVSWAKFEEELPNGKKFDSAKKARIDWGISLRKIIEKNEWKF